MITENVSTLKIHKLTQAQYDRELEAGNIDENALYLTPDEATDTTYDVATTEKDGLMPASDKAKIENSVMIDKSFGIGPDTVAEGDHTHGNLELQMQSLEELINVDYNDTSDAIEFFTDITPSHTLWEVSDATLVTDVDIQAGRYVCTTSTPEEGVKTHSMYDMVDIVKGKTIVAVANISSENYTLYIKMYNGTAWSFGRVKKNNKVVSVDVPADLVNFKLGLEYAGTEGVSETCEMTNFALYVVNDVTMTSTANIPNRNYTIWSWHDEGLNDPDTFADFCKSYRINRIYQCMQDTWDFNDIRNFVGTMQKNKINVNWLTGDPTWALSAGHYHIANEVQKVVDYNMSIQNDYEKIGTIQFDIEPYTLDEWDTDQESVIKQYQDAVVLMYEESIAKQLSLNMCVPSWFDTKTYDNEYGQGNLFDFVSKHSSTTVIMAYSNSSYTSISEAEIRMGAENGKNVAIGLETQPVSDGITEDVTFANKSIEDLYRAFETLFLIYKIYGVYKGYEFVIHHYTDFKTYIESFNLTVESNDILSKLTTTDKTDLISSINEVNSKVAAFGSAGSATQPVYFADGVPTATTYKLNKTVPANAVFTDTTYDAATTSEDGLMSAVDKVAVDTLAPVTTAGTGAAYTASISGITALTTGLCITIIPHTVSTSQSATLNLNSLGAKQIKRRNSKGATTTYIGYSAPWLAANKPYTLIYDGTYWIVESLTKPVAEDVTGVLAVSNGGTGVNSLTAGSYLVGNGTSDVAFKTPADVLTDIGAAPTNHTHDEYAPIDHTHDDITVPDHTHAASKITAGTLGGKVVAQTSAVSALNNAQVRNIYAGTSDLTAGTSTLTTGNIYLVYE